MPRTELIITGFPRSGTSYLCNLLHRYDDCVVLNEPKEVRTILQQEEVPYGLRDFFAATRRKILNGQPIENKLTNGEVTMDTKLSGKRSFYKPEPQTDAFVLGVKNTQGILARFEAVREVMCGAHIVACVRNPVDTIGSWKKSFVALRDGDVVTVPVGHVNDPWLPPADKARVREIASTTDPALRRALRWRYFAEIILRNREHLHVVRYEDLAAAPGATLARIFAGRMPGRPTGPILSSEPRATGHDLDAHDREVIQAVCTDLAKELDVREAA